MKAVVMPKINDRKRTPLQSVLPLDVPFSIQIDIADACNLKCNFCFHSDLDSVKKYNVHFGIMKMDVYKKIIDDIQIAWGNVKKVKKLRLFAHGEPLLNKHIIEMIRYAKMADVAEMIELTTNGTLFNQFFNDNYAEAGMDIINISVNGINAEQYRTQCGYDLVWDDFIDGIRDLYEHRGECRVFIKLSDIGYSESEKEEFFDVFGDICDQIFVEGISSTLWQDTDISDKVPKNRKGIYGQEIVRKSVCTTIFTTMVINSRGQAKLCCADWKNELIIGDTTKQTIEEIWKCESLRKMQIAFLEGKRDSIPMCQACESPEVTTPDNVDLYANDILQKYLQND